MNSAHLHLITNHAPLFALVAALLLLAWATVRKSPEVRAAAYGAFVLAGLAAIVAYATGARAESMVEDLPGITEAAIERHQEAAAFALAAICATGLLGLAGLLGERLRLQFGRFIVTALFILGLAATGIVAYASNLGGLIHHTEITAHK